MKTPPRSFRALAGLVLLLNACGPDGRLAPPVLSPPETFDWNGQRITVSPPPAGWRREGETGGGVKGARFVKERSVGEGIGLGDYYLLSDRRDELRQMLQEFSTYDRGFAWDRAIRAAYAHTDQTFTPLEAEIAERINSAVSSADAAFRRSDRDAAREFLEDAFANADRLRFTLADVIERVEFKPERRQEPHRYTVTGRRDATVAGEPAVIVDYTVAADTRTFVAREVYFVHKSHLFIGTFIGLAETLPVFDAIIASVGFPQ